MGLHLLYVLATQTLVLAPILVYAVAPQRAAKHWFFGRGSYTRASWGSSGNVLTKQEALERWQALGLEMSEELGAWQKRQIVSLTKEVTLCRLLIMIY